MKKKKLKKRLKRMEAEISQLKARPRCDYCENHKPRTVKFLRYRRPPLELGYLHDDMY